MLLPEINYYFVVGLDASMNGEPAYPTAAYDVESIVVLQQVPRPESLSSNGTVVESKSHKTVKIISAKYKAV